jgi:ubiquinone/menaquinone biosynthesis C-methylase UbiE
MISSMPDPNAQEVDSNLPAENQIPISVSAALSKIPFPPNGAVLDVGCGPGALTGQLLDRVGNRGRVVGIDPDSEELAVAQARWRHDMRRDRMQFLQAAADELPFITSNEFDVVWMSHVGHHLPDPDQAFRELLRVTRPSGTIAVLDGDLGGSFPFLPWPPDLEDAIRAASWNAAMDAYGGNLDYTYDPFFGRRMAGALRTAGWIAPRLHALPELIQAPLLPAQVREISGWLITWMLGRLQGYLEPTVHQRVKTLVDIDNEESLLHSPDFFFSRIWYLCTAIAPEQS